MDARIILAGQQPDIIGSAMRGQQFAANRQQMQDQNRLRQLFQSQGPSIMAGDQNALAQLAQIDPRMAMSVQSDRLSMENTQQLMAQRAAEYARGLSAQEAAAEAAKIEQGLLQGIRFYQSGDLDGLNAHLATFNIPPIDDLSQFAAVAAPYKAALDGFKSVLDMTGGPDAKDRYRTVGNQLVDLYAEGGPSSVLSGQTPGQSFSVTTPDGTTVQMGPAGVPTGQNEGGTATPRDGGTLSREMSKADATFLGTLRDAANAATDLESMSQRIQTLLPSVGYTGPGGKFVGWLDDLATGVGAPDLISSGDSGARGAFRSLSMDARLTFTEKTKGAITDREMADFEAAAPGLLQSADGNKMIAEMMGAGAARVQTRAAFFENWARKHGSLEGAQEVWSEYMRDNPIIVRGENGLSIAPEGNWSGYLDRKPANSYTPEAIMQMGPAELAQIPIERMTATQLDAMELRFQMLGGGQ